MALHSLYCADVPLRNSSLTQPIPILSVPIPTLWQWCVCFLTAK